MPILAPPEWELPEITTGQVTLEPMPILEEPEQMGISPGTTSAAPPPSPVESPITLKEGGILSRLVSTISDPLRDPINIALGLAICVIFVLVLLGGLRKWREG